MRNVTVAVLCLFLVRVAWAQEAPTPKPAAARLTFDVASVRLDVSGGKPKSNLAIGPGNVWGPSGGVLSTKNFSLLMFISFAYKMPDYQISALQAKLPEWALSERFDIEARTDKTNATKDEMREMMQSLLADRFALAVHYELRNVPVYALTLVKPGTTGPKLRPHPANATCQEFSLLLKTADGQSVVKLPDAGPDGFPTFCGGILDVPARAQDRYSFGARDVPMSMIASSFSSWGNLGRPVVDKTGLAGAWDFVLDFTPDPRPRYATIDSGGPSFQEGLKQQLGFKLESTKGDVEFLVLDHLEHPTKN
jgi:uncharacterized protein (TIGR03435 family)